MIHRVLADLTVVVHSTFILFVVVGGFLALRWPRLVWAHLPAALWGAAIEFGGWICPLTPLEKWFRVRSGEAGYAGGFIEHYLLPIVYPAGLTRTVQIVLGSGVILVNIMAYLLIWRRRARGRG